MPRLLKLLALTLFFFPVVGNSERVEPLKYNPFIVQSAASAFLDTKGVTYTLTLPDIQVAIPPASNGPTQTGIVYRLPEAISSSQLSWKPIASGYVAHIHLVANQAKRLRLHLQTTKLQSVNVFFRVQGNLDSTPLGPIDRASINQNEIWLPITNGDNTDLEIFIESPNYPDADLFILDAINFIVVGNKDGIIPYSLGLAIDREYDLACWSGVADYSGLSEAAAATAKINYIDNGGSFLCSGTLLNDKGGTKTPWFATANHCLTNQTIANTASFEWFFQATQCGGSQNDARYTQTYGGAQLLWTDFNLEIAFLRLNQAPASGAIFSGWETTINVGDLVWAVHHPQGDQTMVSEGNVTALLQIVDDISQGGTHTLDSVVFSYGGTEPGSSGSGLFSVSNGNAYWKGTLFGGPANDYQSSSYSHFGSYYNKVQSWLGASASPKPTIQFTASPSTVNYGSSSLLQWTTTNAASCTASGGWSGSVATSGSISTAQLTSNTVYTLTCNNSAGSTTNSITITVNTPSPTSSQISCLFAWAEQNYPQLFSPAGNTNVFTYLNYKYRYYSSTNFYLAVSSVDNHVYLMSGADNILRDAGQFIYWQAIASCQ